MSLFQHDRGDARIPAGSFLLPWGLASAFLWVTVRASFGRADLRVWRFSAAITLFMIIVSAVFVTALRPATLRWAGPAMWVCAVVFALCWALPFPDHVRWLGCGAAAFSWSITAWAVAKDA